MTWPSDQTKKTMIELMTRLLWSGHSAERLVFIFSFGLVCLMGGLVMGRMALGGHMMTLPLPVEMKAQVSRKQGEENGRTGDITQASTMEKDETRAPLTVRDDAGSRKVVPHEFFFSIRIAALIEERDAQSMVEKYKSHCNDISTRYSSIHRRYMVYCGAFDDFSTANRFSQTLDTSDKLIVRRTP
jgi:hypothetical protein